VSGRLDGRVALVTGGGSGIGRVTSLLFAAEGATVVVADRRRDAADKVVAECAAAGGKAIAMEVDVSRSSDVARMVADTVARCGRLDVLVNNVYKIPDPPAWGGGFWDHPVSIWDDQVGIGLRAHYVASWHAAPLLFAAGPGGAIVNVSSPGGRSYHFSSSYGAGKAGLDRLSADMAIELAPKGIACCSVYPGSVATEFILEWAGERGSDMSTMQTTLGVGRAIAALVVAPDLMERSGSIQWIEDISRQFDTRDENGNLAAPYPRR